MADPNIIRINKIAGQVTGLKIMCENPDNYGTLNIITQISAVIGALKGLSLNLLSEHIDQVATDKINETAISDINLIVQRMVK